MLASEEVGWPSSRYKAEGTAFVVREMSGVHHREARYGEALDTRTCIAESRRGILLRRETWVADVMRSTVEWAHVGADGVPKRAGPSVTEVFTVKPAESVVLPEFLEHEPEPLPEFAVVPWYTEMDPLGHTNHPRYVDWADEALSQALAEAGLDPLELVPVAENLRFRGSARAGDRVAVRLHRVGRAAEVQVYEVGIHVGDTRVCHGRIWRLHPPLTAPRS